MVSSNDDNIFSFNKVQFVYFSFVNMDLLSYPRMYCQHQCHQSFALCFLLIGFFTLELINTFRPLIHFELICIWFWDKDPISYFCMWLSSFPNTVVGKTATYPLNVVLEPLLANHLTIDVCLLSSNSILLDFFNNVFIDSNVK